MSDEAYAISVEPDMNAQYFKQAGVVVLGSLAVFGLAITFYAVWLAYSPLPFWDQWERVTVGQHLSRLFEQHNEHRIVVPTFAFIVDVVGFSGRNSFSLFLIQAIQFLHVLLLIRVAARAGIRHTDLGVVGALFVFFLFCGTQIENFYWGFQVQFVLVYLLATVCFSLAVLGRDNWRMDAAAVTAGTGAAFSFSAGLMVLPAAAVAVFLCRGSLRRVLVLATAGGVCAFLYTRGLGAVGHSDPMESLKHPISVLYYMLVYIGGPFGDALSKSAITNIVPTFSDRIFAAQLFGGGALVASLGALVITVWRRGPKGRHVLLMICGLTVVAALLTSLGRWELGAQQAFASRYATPVMLFWASLGAWAWSLTRNMPWAAWRQGAQLLLTGAYIIAALLLLSNRESWLDLARVQNDRLSPAESAVLVGAPDEDVLRGVYPWPDRVMERRIDLHDARLSVFASEAATWLGEPLEQIATVSDESACLGSFDVRLVVEEGGQFVRLNGWAWDVARRKGPDHYLVVSPSNQIVGVGQLAMDRPDVGAAIPVIDKERTGWMAHAEIPADETLTVYALLGSGRMRQACRIGTK